MRHVSADVSSKCQYFYRASSNRTSVCYFRVGPRGDASSFSFIHPALPHASIPCPCRCLATDCPHVKLAAGARKSIRAVLTHCPPCVLLTVSQGRRWSAHPFWFARTVLCLCVGRSGRSDCMADIAWTSRKIDSSMYTYVYVCIRTHEGRSHCVAPTPCRSVRDRRRRRLTDAGTHLPHMHDVVSTAHDAPHAVRASRPRCLRRRTAQRNSNCRLAGDGMRTRKDEAIARDWWRPLALTNRACPAHDVGVLPGRRSLDDGAAAATTMAVEALGPNASLMPAPERVCDDADAASFVMSEERARVAARARRKTTDC